MAITRQRIGVDHRLVWRSSGRDSFLLQYAGPAPSYVAGLEQVNIEIPPGLLAGNNFLNVTIGNRTIKAPMVVQ